MPDELLQVVFAMHQAEMDHYLRADLGSGPSWQKLKQAPFIFASVSRGWRPVALATPSHWSRIVLTFDKSWQETRATALLGLHLGRSGEGDLKFSIIGSPMTTQNAGGYEIGSWDRFANACRSS